MRERLERQTTVKFNDKDGEATIETQMDSIRRRMEKIGYYPDSTSHGMTVFRIPKERVRIRAVRSLELLQQIEQGAYDILEKVTFNGLQKFERETVINFNEAEKEAWVATRHKGIINFMRKHGVRLYRKQGDYLCFSIPKRWVRFGKQLSTEERVQRRLRGQKAYRARQSNASPQEDIGCVFSPQKPAAVEDETEKKIKIVGR